MNQFLRLGVVFVMSRNSGLLLVMFLAVLLSGCANTESTILPPPKSLSDRLKGILVDRDPINPSDSMVLSLAPGLESFGPGDIVVQDSSGLVLRRFSSEDDELLKSLKKSRVNAIDESRVLYKENTQDSSVVARSHNVKIKYRGKSVDLSSLTFTESFKVETVSLDDIDALAFAARRADKLGIDLRDTHHMVVKSVLLVSDVDVVIASRDIKERLREGGVSAPVTGDANEVSIEVKEEELNDKYLRFKVKGQPIVIAAHLLSGAQLGTGLPDAASQPLKVRMSVAHHCSDDVVPGTNAPSCKGTAWRGNPGHPRIGGGPHAGQPTPLYAPCGFDPFQVKGRIRFFYDANGKVIDSSPRDFHITLGRPCDPGFVFSDTNGVRILDDAQEADLQVPPFARGARVEIEAAATTFRYANYEVSGAQSTGASPSTTTIVRSTVLLNHGALPLSGKFESAYESKFQKNNDHLPHSTALAVPAANLEFRFAQVFPTP